MVKVADLIDGQGVKSRRERLGISQGALAERVRKLSGKKFSQQALGKFEKGGESAFSIYIINALYQLENESGVSFVRPSNPETAALQQSMDGLSDTELKGKIVEIMDRLSARDSIEVAQVLLEQAKKKIPPQ